MFTGIIEATANLTQISKNQLRLERPKSFNDLKIGCSIAVSGVCLSVTAFDASSMTFDVVETTLKKTKLGSLRTGDLVNLERAMKADGRFEGHIVTGHCEGTGRVLRVEDGMVEISIPPSLQKYLVLHGSITIDGVALTVAELSGSVLSVALIPHTLQNTTLGTLKAGDTVNLETDILGRYILSAHDKK